MATFEQILEMDEDDEEKEFSKSIVYGFFDQTETTLVDLANALYVVCCCFDDHCCGITSSALTC